MLFKRMWRLTCILLLAAGSLSAESVYIWTDENGVRHYSNTGIPTEVQDADERPELIIPEVDRSLPGAPVDNEIEEGLTDPRNNVPGEVAPEVDRSGSDARLGARIAEERRMLLAQIEQIENLGIGVSFTPGMKAARIRPLKERLALLEADPVRYFRMKRAGAFDNGTATGEQFVKPPPAALGDPLESMAPESTYGSGSSEEPQRPAEQP